MHKGKKYIICRYCGTAVEKEKDMQIRICPICGKLFDYRRLIVDLNILKEPTWKS